MKDKAARTENLAIILQEVLTATVRLKSGRQQVTDAQTFRMQMREALRGAEREGRARGYSEMNMGLAIFAVVAFLDEVILNLRSPIFADWVGRPLQGELFGGHVAGEAFFENLTRLLAQSDSAEVADVLEVYQLCLLLGYQGRYGIAPHSGLVGQVHAVKEKIQRIRGPLALISPESAPPRNEAASPESDPWLRPLLFGAAACFVLVIILLFGFNLSLNSAAGELGALNAQSRSN
jgi:type VI secretion system protein ImpK